MVVVRFRSESDAKDTIKKLKKMHKFTKELIECFEDKYEDDEEDDDEDYRYDDDMHREMMRERRAAYRSRYRRGM
jgi:hypothetical protein